MSLKKSQDKKLPVKKKQNNISVSFVFLTFLKVNMSMSLSKGIRRTDGTNNICKEWNNKFFNLVGLYRPSIGRVIEWFQREEATVSTIMLLQPPLRTKNSSSTATEFLRGVGWNSRLKRSSLKTLDIHVNINI